MANPWFSQGLGAVRGWKGGLFLSALDNLLQLKALRKIFEGFACEKRIKVRSETNVKDFHKDNGPDDLSKVLREWRADAALPPGFQASVWRQIDAAAAQPHRKPFTDVLVGWFNQFVARPQMAVAYIALLVMIGVTAGWTQGQREASRVQDQLAQQYIATLDPYQRGR